jgi:hypothetical protein
MDALALSYSQGRRQTTSYHQSMYLGRAEQHSDTWQAARSRAVLAENPVLAENSHPFENLSLRTDNTFGLFGLTSRLLVWTTVFGQDRGVSAIGVIQHNNRIQREYFFQVLVD